MADVPFDIGALTDYLFNHAEVVKELLSTALYEQIHDALTGEPSPEAIQRARDLARDAAESLTKTLTQSQLQSMGEVIADAIDAGKRPYDTWRDLDMVTELDSVRAAQLKKYADSLGDNPNRDALIAAEKEQLLDERRKVIAQTEGRNATAYARDVAARLRGARFKAWITAGDARVSDACQMNEAKGSIPIDDEFPSGAMTPPGHPRCRCTLAYVTSDKAKDVVDRDQSQRAEKTKAAKEGESSE